MFIKSRILLAGAASLLTLIACNSNNSPQGAAPAKDAVAATVNGTPISESLVGMMLKQRTNLGRPADPESRKTFIDSLAMQLIISQEAVKKGLDKAPEVSDRIELNRQSILIEAFVQDRNTEDPIYSTLFPSIPPNGGWHSKAKHLTLLSNHRINRRRNHSIP